MGHLVLTWPIKPIPKNASWGTIVSLTVRVSNDGRNSLKTHNSALSGSKYANIDWKSGPNFSFRTC